MSLFSTIITVIFFTAVYGIIPDEYNRAAAICISGSVVPYILIKILSLFKLQKIMNLFSWLIMYIVLCIYGYAINNIELSLFSFGAVCNIFIQFITGGKVILLFPYKQYKFKTIITPFFSLALFVISIVLLCLVYINTISSSVVILLGILLYILLVLNIDFFKRLSNIIHYVLKIDIEELERSHKEDTIKILLKEISPLWTRNKAVISLQSLANGTWLADEPKEETITWEFSNDEINIFWNNEINKPKYREEFKNAAGEILSFLDKYGSCPSVVKEQSKSFGKYGYADEKTTFDILYNQTLINHTLSLCRLILRDIKIFQGINLEKMLLTALGHDIGKAASFSNIDGYKTGDHPNTSIMLIETRFNYFDKLPYADEITKMIKNHHGTPSAATPLLQDFKDYDSKARREYLREYFKKSEQQKEQENKHLEQQPAPKLNNTIVNNNISEEKTNDNINNSFTAEKSTDIIKEPEQSEHNTGFIPSFIVSSTNNIVEENIKDTINTNQPEINKDEQKVLDSNQSLKNISSNDALYADLSNTDVPNSYMISNFFNINEFLKNVSKSINVIDRTKFNYFTVNGDMVLCYTAAVIYEVKKAARTKKITDINNIKENEIAMSFTEYCRKLGILHTDWIQEGYYQGNFALTDNDGNIVRTGRYIPLRIDAFAEYGTYSEFEERKKGVLENIINAKVATKEEMFQNI